MTGKPRKPSDPPSTETKEQQLEQAEPGRGASFADIKPVETFPDPDEIPE